MRPDLARFTLLGTYHASTIALAWAARNPSRLRGPLLFGGSARTWDAMSDGRTQALFGLIDRDWDLFAESAAHAWLGWTGGEDGRLLAASFREAVSPATARRHAGRRAQHRMSTTCWAASRHRRWCSTGSAPARCRSPCRPSSSRALPQRAAGPSARARRRACSSSMPRMTSMSSRRSWWMGIVDTRTAGAGRIARRHSLRARRTCCDSSRPANPTPPSPIAWASPSTPWSATPSNLYRKIDARGRADATAWAVRHGLAEAVEVPVTRDPCLRVGRDAPAA